MFDDVYLYLTPRERANIEFILEKEKTNLNISDEEQFQFFLEIYFDKKNYTPSMLESKFLGVQNCCFSFCKQLPSTKKYVYLVHSFFGGCNECSAFLSIYQYNKKGELLNTFDLGNSDEILCMGTESDNNYKIWFAYYPGPRFAFDDDEVDEKTREEAHNTPIDTIRLQLHYDKNEQIVINKR